MKKYLSILTALLLGAVTTMFAQPNTWTQKADFGGGLRAEAVSFSIGGKGYAGTGQLTKDFWEYDPAANTWTRKADFPGEPRSRTVGFAIGNKGYVGGGENNFYGPYFTDFWEYNPETDHWTKKADLPGKARHYQTAFSIANKGYYGTGADNASGPEYYFSDFWEYDPAANTWTRKADVGGGGRDAVTSFSIGNKGYIGTGYSFGSRKDFWEYDPATDKWTQKANFGGSARHLAKGFSIGSKGYLGTGCVALGGAHYKDFWEYDPATNTWTRKADVGGSDRRDAISFSIGNKGYLGTGDNPTTAGFKDFWEYTPDSSICPAPTRPKVEDVSNTAAQFKWQVAGTDVLHVRVRYRAVGDATWSKKNKIGAHPSLHIDGLMPNTTYQWQLRSSCAADTSDWVAGPDFTTTAAFAMSPDKASVGSNNAGTVSVQVVPNPSKGNFTVQMRLPATATPTTLTLHNDFGQLVWQQHLGTISGAVQRTITLENKLPAGLYTLTIQRSDIKLTRKILINK